MRSLPIPICALLLAAPAGVTAQTTSPEARIAASFAGDAYGRYGKGVGSPGVLNHGDVLSYGVARAEDEPLLFKSEDFPQTDIHSARQ